MAEKSPLAHALEKNTKALQAVHKSRGQAGGAGAVSDSYDSPLSLGQAAGLQFQKRKQAFSSAVGGRLTSASNFMRGGFMRKIPSMGIGGFLADTLESRRESREDPFMEALNAKLG